MSKGTTIYTMRIPDELIAQVEGTMSRLNHYRRDEPLTRSAFFLAAIREKLHKMERSRRSKKNNQPARS